MGPAASHHGKNTSSIQGGVPGEGRERKSSRQEWRWRRERDVEKEGLEGRTSAGTLPGAATLGLALWSLAAGCREATMAGKLPRAATRRRSMKVRKGGAGASRRRRCALQQWGRGTVDSRSFAVQRLSDGREEGGKAQGPTWASSPTASAACGRLQAGWRDPATRVGLPKTMPTLRCSPLRRALPALFPSAAGGRKRAWLWL